MFIKSIRVLYTFLLKYVLKNSVTNQIFPKTKIKNNENKRKQRNRKIIDEVKCIDKLYTAIDFSVCNKAQKKTRKCNDWLYTIFFCE